MVIRAQLFLAVVVATGCADVRPAVLRATCHDNLQAVYLQIKAHINSVEYSANEGDKLSLVSFVSRLTNREECQCPASPETGYIVSPNLDVSWFSDSVPRIIACDSPGSHTGETSETAAFLLSNGRVQVRFVNSEKYKVWTQRYASGEIDAELYPQPVED